MNNQEDAINRSLSFANTLEAPAGWDDLAEEVYQTTTFLRHFFPTALFLSARENDRLVGGIAYCLGLSNDKQVAVALPNFLYGGPFGKYRKQLLERYLSLPFVSGAAIIDGSGQKLEKPTSTFSSEVIHFKDYDSWFTSIDPDARNQIRQATKRGLTLGTFKRFDALDAKTALRHGRQVQKQWTRSLLSYGEKYGAKIGAYYNTKLIAAVILARHKEKAYLLKNVSLSRYWQYRPNHLLYSGAVQWAVEHGCTSLNTGGAEFDGLRNFKRSLGSQEHIYYSYSRG